MKWNQIASIADFVPRLIVSNIQYEDAPGAPAHWDYEANILNARPSGKWPRLTGTLVDVVAVPDVATPGGVPAIAGVDVTLLVSTSNPDPVWWDDYNTLSTRLLGYAVGYLHAHPTKTWALAGAGGDGLLVEWRIERLVLAPDVMNGFFVAARVPTMPAAAYRVHVESLETLASPPKFPADWKAESMAALTGSTAIAAAEAYAASNDRPLVWVDGAPDAATLARLATTGHIFAFRDENVRVGKRIDIASLPPGSVLVTDDADVLATVRKRRGAVVLDR